MRSIPQILDYSELPDCLPKIAATMSYVPGVGCGNGEGGGVTKVVHPNGIEEEYATLNRRDAVGALGVLVLDQVHPRDSDVLMSAHWRPNKGGIWVIEALGGAIEEDEEPTEAILREVEEESGRRAQVALPIGETVTWPSTSTHTTRNFILSQFDEGNPGDPHDLTENERIVLFSVPLGRAFEFMRKSPENKGLPIHANAMAILGELAIHLCSFQDGYDQANIFTASRNYE